MFTPEPATEPNKDVTKAQLCKPMSIKVTYRAVDEELLTGAEMVQRWLYHEKSTLSVSDSL